MDLIKKIWFIFDRTQKRNFIILFIIIFVGGFVELLGISAVLPLVDVIMDYSKIETNKIYHMIYSIMSMDSPRQFVTFMAIALTIIYVFKNMYILEMYNLQFRFTYNNQRRLAYRLMSCYMNQDYLYHVSRNSAILQRNLTHDINNFFGTVLYILQLGTEVIVCVMLVAYLLLVDFTTTIGVIVIIGVFALVFYFIYREKLVKGGQRYRYLSGLIIQWIQQALGGIKEIKILNKESYFLQMFDSHYEKSMRTMRTQKMINLMPRPLMETLCIGGLLAVIAIRISLGEDMEQFVSTLSVFVLAAFRMLPSFNRITTQLSNIMFSRVSVDCIYEEMMRTELRVENAQLVETRKNDVVTMEYNKDIRLENLRFRYPETESDVLKGISLIIPKNKSVAFIGASGSGKTTLVDTILGVLRPDAGNIWCDDEDIWSNIEGWHANIGYIPQTIYLMDDTIRNNIAFGIRKEDISDEKIWNALRDAQLERFVRELPEGLNTFVGEKGVRLSGGQRQRIGIARALYSNPQILVMDEATSALDNDTEKGVMEAIGALNGKKTILIVAHRLTTVVNCDYIYEIVNGKSLLVSKEEILNRINNNEKES